MVEMLTVWARSPPVPTTSTQSPGTSIRTACSSIPAASPASSSTVSPLDRSATRKPATWTGLASPSMTWPMAHSASARDRSCPAISAVRTCGQLFSAELFWSELFWSVPGVEVLTPQPSRRRASSATAPATAAGSSGCGTARSAWDQEASQASSRRPVRTRIGGQR